MRAVLKRWFAASAMFGAVVLTACPESTSPPTVASVKMTATSSNPRVGETSNITAKGVTAGGLEVLGATCTFSSANPAIASVGGTTGVVTALAVGTAVITATCGGQSNSITITVRPVEFTLTLTKTGLGTGAVFASPAGLTYDAGTVVSITATANAGSVFTGWGGDCAGTTQPCTVTMSTNRSVTADFADGETFALATAFGGNMTSVNDPAPPGCAYTVSSQFTSFALMVRTTTATGTVNSNITVASTGGSCTGNPFAVTATGTLTVAGNTITGTLTFFSTARAKDTQTLTINATRNTNAITGTVSINQKLYNGVGTEFTSTGGPYAFTLNKVP
jgi:uncharacterized repeat protein (TIGR02543 family)